MPWELSELFSQVQTNSGYTGINVISQRARSTKNFIPALVVGFIELLGFVELLELLGLIGLLELIGFIGLLGWVTWVIGSCHFVNS